METAPIMTTYGVTQAQIELNGEGGEFEYVWFKEEMSGKVLRFKSAASPKPYVLKATFDRGQVIRPMAYGSKCGLFEGDAFEVSVGDWKPTSKYPGYPKGVGGKPLFDEAPAADSVGDEAPPKYTNAFAARLAETTQDGILGGNYKVPELPSAPVRRDGLLSVKPNNLICDSNGRNCKFTSRD